MRHVRVFILYTCLHVDFCIVLLYFEAENHVVDVYIQGVDFVSYARTLPVFSIELCIRRMRLHYI